MSEFKQYKRKAIAELRPVTKAEIFHLAKGLKDNGISVSEVDEDNGSPKAGDMIARNPENHNDQWLVAADYFAVNFEEVENSSQLGKIMLYSIVNSMMQKGVNFEILPPYKSIIIKDENGSHVLSIDEALKTYGSTNE